MDKLFKLIEKRWFYISMAFTLISSLITGGWWLKGKVDNLISQVAATNDWVQDHDDALQTLHDDVLKLKEDERLREAGLLK